jgi:Domain of unkown function (DUF1775)
LGEEVLTRRIAAVVAGVALGAVALAGSAFAHVEVSAKPAQALAKDAVISFSAEAESGSAGIASIHVVLPQGIAPADVTYVSGPAGWQLAATADGYTVSGKALGVHKAVDYTIKVSQLPNAKTLAFKSLVNYSNGDVDRWIELPTSGNPSPDHPAPILKLAAAPSPTSAPATEISPSPSASSPASAVTVSAVSADPAGSAPASIWGWAVVAALAAIAAALAITLIRRKSARN